MKNSVVIVGAGAAGFFAAINLAERLPLSKIYLLEGARSGLAKVKISGGGRCNVTHNCFEPKLLTSNYPRGQKELRGPFHKFQPQDTVRWFETRGVKLKAEEDGRIFPRTDSSQTIIDCFQKAAARCKNLEVRYSERVTAIKRMDNKFAVHTSANSYLCDSVLLSSGSSSSGYKLAASLGHAIVSPVPSLFTFKTDSAFIKGLAGTSFDNVKIDLLVAGKKLQKFQSTGPLLITHWGFSGPGLLKISAFAARALNATKYNAELKINFLAPVKLAGAIDLLMSLKDSNSPKKKVTNCPPAALTKRAWEQLLSTQGFSPEMQWHQVTNKRMQKIAEALTSFRCKVNGRSVNKDEFVTAGGVDKTEIDFRTMESKIVPGFFMAGEVIDIDGVTGGFNFQNAWTGAYIIAETLASRYHGRMAVGA